MSVDNNAPNEVIELESFDPAPILERWSNGKKLHLRASLKQTPPTNNNNNNASPTESPSDQDQIRSIFQKFLQPIRAEVQRTREQAQSKEESNQS